MAEQALAMLHALNCTKRGATASRPIFMLACQLVPLVGHLHVFHENILLIVSHDIKLFGIHRRNHGTKSRNELITAVYFHFVLHSDVANSLKIARSTQTNKCKKTLIRNVETSKQYAPHERTAREGTPRNCSTLMIVRPAPWKVCATVCEASIRSHTTTSVHPFSKRLKEFCILK